MGDYRGRGVSVLLKVVERLLLTLVPLWGNEDDKIIDIRTKTAAWGRGMKTSPPFHGSFNWIRQVYAGFLALVIWDSFAQHRTMTSRRPISA